MSAIQFFTTPKGDLPHYYYIFRKTEPLGIEMKNVVCSRLGTMLHLDIQNGKEAMKTSGFKKYLGGNAVCIKRLLIATKWCGKMKSNDTYFDDSWFSSVKTAEESIPEGVDYCRPAKTIHTGFCLATLEKLTEYWPGRSYLVMKSTPRVPGGRPLRSIG